ncbi:MAG: YggT family protein [Candidatus Paracaedibacteraceae bacterium]|nr:YggT family protein [Candidatus Paracaedibacteraceae bacterium]
MNQILLIPFLELIDGLLWFYQFLIIIAVILNLLAALNILNTYNRGVFVLINTINRFTDPALYHIRRFIPTFGGLDFSPVIGIFLVHVLRNIVKTLQLYLS